MVDINGLPPLPKCFSDVTNDFDPDDDTENRTLVNGQCSESDSESPTSKQNGTMSGSLDVSTSLPSPFARLNSALSKLREEMVPYDDVVLVYSQESCEAFPDLKAGLRKLDVSLLTQLWSLNDAIQEYKSAMQDRFSETNSEYSWGMNSRTSSMCSIDECDWNDELYPKMDNGPIGGSLGSSTSSLLQQINELRERAESEF